MGKSEADNPKSGIFVTFFFLNRPCKNKPKFNQFVLFLSGYGDLDTALIDLLHKIYLVS